MDYILSLYDIRGIQNYVYASNKLKENIGASSLVQEALSKQLPKAMEKVSEKVIADWEKKEEIKIFSDSGIMAEVVYIGGGNAMIISQDKKTAIEITKNLSKKLLETTGGQITLSVIHKEFDKTNLNSKQNNNIKEFYEELDAELFEVKQKQINTYPLMGIAITKEGITDGFPAATIFEIEEKEYISLPTYKKREKAKNDFFLDLIDDNFKNEFTFPKELDMLGMKSGEDDNIAVVHIDGNNMGQTINKVRNSTDDYEKSLQQMRELSKNINEQYNETMASVITLLIKNIGNIEKHVKLKMEKKKKCLPVIPIILNGDDVTFVAHGKIGIFLAEHFLKELSKKSISIDNDKKPLSACAGVAIVNSHFPFYRAYELSEELCKSAKTKGKIIAEEDNDAEVNNNSDNIGCWLDFHIVQSGLSTSLDAMRKKNYNVPSMKEPAKLEYKSMNKSQYNLLYRPWYVTADKQDLKNDYEKYCFEEVKRSLVELHKLPRNKIKNLRNQFIKSESDVKIYYDKMKSRNKKLPNFHELKEEIFKEDNMTPYFDMIELMEFYLIEDYNNDKEYNRK